MNADFLGHAISPAGIRPKADNVAASTNMPMSVNIKQLRSMLENLTYWRTFLPKLATPLPPITGILKQGVKFVFTKAIGTTVRGLVAELSRPPILVFTTGTRLKTAHAVSRALRRRHRWLRGNTGTKTARRLCATNRLHQSHNP